MKTCISISQSVLASIGLGHRAAVALVLALLSCVRAGAQILADPVSVPVNFLGQFDAIATGNPSMPANVRIFVQNAGPNSLSAYGESNGGFDNMTGAGFARLRPGQTYLFEIGTYSATHLRVKVTAPSGYRVFINGVEHEMFEWAKAGGVPLDAQGFFSVRLDDGSGAAVGATESLRPGRVLWSIGLGNLKNGKSAGSIRLTENGLSASAYAPSSLYYDRDAGNQNGRYASEETDVIVVKVENNLRQVYTTTVLADISDYDPISHSYHVRLFPRTQVTDPDSSSTTLPFNVSGTPLYDFLIENPNYPNVDKIRITRTTNVNGSLTMWTEMAKSVPATGYTQWIVQDWVNKLPGDVAVTSPVRHTWTYSDGDRNEHMRIEDGNGVPARVVFKRYEDQNFGIETTRELCWEVQGGNPDPLATAANAESPNSIKKTYTYHTAWNESSLGNWHRVATIEGNDGSRSVFTYRNDFKSLGYISESRRPFKDTNPSDPGSGTYGEITTFTYGFTDNFGTARLPTRIETTIDNKITSRTDFAYSYEYPSDSSSTYNYAGNEVMPLVVATRKDYSNGTQYLTTITRTYREDCDPEHRFFPGLLHSVERPDKTVTAMAYFRADSEPSDPFHASISGADRVQVALQGTVDLNMGVSLGNYRVSAQPLPANFRVVAGKSTEARTLLGIAGLPMITEKSIFMGVGNWVSVQQDWNSYTNSIWPEKTKRGNGNSGILWDLVINTWAVGRLESTVDETGIKLQFGYDYAGRTNSTIRIGASGAGTSISTQIFTQTYDAAGSIRARSTSVGSEALVSTTNYDTAGRVISQSAPGQGTTNIAYDVVNRTVTTTLPTSSTQVEKKWRDGRTYSVTGTAVVAQHFDADIEVDGRRKSVSRVRSSNDVRKQEVWTDWLGRMINTSRPGFLNGTAFTESMTYDSATGQTVASSRSGGYADTVYQYNGMGERVRTGLNLDGNPGLQEASNDRITDADATVESYDGAYWLTSRTWAFSQIGSTSKVLTSVVRQRLTGLSPTLRAETRSWDAENNETRRTVTVDVAAKIVTVVTTRPGMAGNATEVTLNGFPVSITGHDGLNYRQTYDGLGRLQSVVDPRTGTATGGTFLYQNNTSLVYQRRDASNRVVATTFYDAAGRPVFSQDAGTGTIRTAYNPRGQVEFQWGSGSYPVSFVYDEYGQRTHQRTYRDPSSTVANYWESTTWPGGSVGAADTEWEYDDYTGLLKKKYDANRQFVEYTYNERGQTAQRYWARSLNGQRVSASYTYVGGTGELSSITYNDTTPSIIYGAYTRLGQPTTVTDYTGTRSFAYDPSAPWRQASENLSTFYGSRSLAVLFETTTTANTGDGSFGGHTIGNVNGRYAGYRLGLNPSTSSYDLEQSYAASSADRLAGLVTKRASGAATRQFVYGYETNSRLVKSLSVVGNGFFVTRSFEATRDLMTQIDSRWSGATRTSYAYTYNDLGQRAAAVQSGGVGEAFEELGATHQRFTYNPRGEVIAARSYNGSDPNSTSDPLSARQHEYDYDSIGNRKWSNTSGQPAVRDNYIANDLNQYTQRENNTLAVQGTAALNAKVAISGPMPTPTGGQVLAGRPSGGSYWGGNIVVANETAPFNGNVTAYAALPGAGPGGKDLFRTETKAAWLPHALQLYSYDADGNLASDGLWNYDWDAENRLIRMTTTMLAASSGRPYLILNFRYDYRHRRVLKEVRNASNNTQISERRFLYDDSNLIAEIDGAANLKRAYVWGADLDGKVQGSGGVGGLLQIYDYEQGKTLFAAYDGNGNIAALVNAVGGTIEAAYEYSPFGEILRSTGSYAANNPFRFSTKWQDDETGLIYYGRRYYNLSQGRFLGRDPIQEKGGLNLYGFCRSNSINLWDVLGMATQLWGADVLWVNDGGSDTTGIPGSPGSGYGQWAYGKWGWGYYNDPNDMRSPPLDPNIIADILGDGSSRTASVGNYLGLGKSTPPSTAPTIWGTAEMYSHYRAGGGDVTLQQIGLLDAVRKSEVTQGVQRRFGDQIAALAATEAARLGAGTFKLTQDFKNTYDFKSVVWAIGSATLSGQFTGTLTVSEDGTFSFNGAAMIAFYDLFTDPYDIFNLTKGQWNPDGTPYTITGSWNNDYSGTGRGKGPGGDE